MAVDPYTMDIQMKKKELTIRHRGLYDDFKIEIGLYNITSAL